MELAMSKKKKKSLAKFDSSTLQAQASYFLQKSCYKEAIDVYKKLLKQEQRQEWQENLAVAYLGRAKALATKGRYKEAVVFWENRDNLCGDKACFLEYIAWLALAGRHLKALRLFVNQSIDDEQNQRFSAFFAPLLLIGDAELAAVLPSESVLYQHYQIIKEALQAYYQGYDDTVKACLKKIPFRSPYRDFGVMLRTLIMLETNPQDALKLAKQIPTQSPFKNFAELVETSLLPIETLVEKMNTLTASEQALITYLKGWNKIQTKMIASLQVAVKRERSTRALFDVVIANQPFFGTEHSRRFCLASLPDYIDGVKRYEKVFGNLSVFEKARVTALNYERRGRIIESDQEWKKCVDILKRHPEQDDNTLKIALIFRHLAEAWITHSNESQIATEYLIDSLRLDPDDKASYLRLLELRDETEDLEPWIMAGVERFPHDRELLLAAIEVSKKEEDFTSAIRFAEVLMKVDPMSTKAKHVVFSCYVEQIRELIKNAEYEQAEQLFIQIEQRYPNHGIVTINRGLLALKKGEEQEAKALFIKGIEQSGNDICGQFRLMAEVALMQITWETVSSLVTLPTRRRSYSPTQQEIVALTKVVEEYAEYPHIFTETFIQPLKSSLKKACTLPFTMVERVNVCHFIKKMEDYKLLKQYAEVGIAQYLDYHPAFSYFRIYAETKGRAIKLTEENMRVLEEAIGIADENNDKSTATMIVSFLRQGLLAQIPPELPPEIERALSNLREEILSDSMDDDEPFESLLPPLWNKK